ncbi:MAG: hypothetical protein WC926_05200, partial [Candidatus Paceibacterota bacterium]
MVSIKKILLFSIISIAIIAALIFFFPSQILGIFFRDIKPIDDSDLTFEKMVVPQEQNAYYDLEEADEKGYWPEGSAEKYESCLEDGICDEKFLKDIYDKNQEFFSIIDKASEKQFFIDPGMESPDKVNNFNAPVYHWVDLISVLPVKIVYLSEKGRDREAMDEAVNFFSLCKKIKEGRPSLIGWAQMIAVEEKTAQAMKFAIGNSKLPPADLLQYSKRLEEFKEDNRQPLVLKE